MLSPRAAENSTHQALRPTNGYPFGGMAQCAHPREAERAGTLPTRLKQVAQAHLNYRRRASLRLLIAFILTFALIRLLTFAIHNNLGPFHDIVIGGGGPNAPSLHIHHYIWGLTLLAICGFLALSLEAVKWHTVLAIPFGIGLALVVDEFALLLQLRDVYWAEGGRTSVDLAVLFAAILLLYYLGQCYWHDVAFELKRGFGYIRRAEAKLAERL